MICDYIKLSHRITTTDLSFLPLDADFDSYWEDEARNPNRNRIRIGRQYQATVPPLLKPGETDGRNLEELETLKWKPENELNDQQLDQYLSLAKAVAVFARAINNSNNNQNSNSNSINSNNCESDSNSNISNSNSNKTENQSGDDQDSNSKEDSKNKESSDSLNSLPSEQLQFALKGLSDFVTSHHPYHHDVGCKVPINSSERAPTSSLINSCETNPKLVNWTSEEIDLFAKALVVCGKNFSAIKKEFLPWKSVKSIIEYYYLESNRSKLNESNPCVKNCETCPEMDEIDSNKMSAGSPLAIANVHGSLRESLDRSSPSSILNLNHKDSDCKMLPNGVCSNAKDNCRRKGEEDEEDEMDDAETNVSKEKPVLPCNDASSVASNLGSLKFYMDGQLVLKLNAKQEVTGRKCHWVESQDTPKISRPLRKGNKKLILERLETDTKIGHVHNDRCMHQNNDDGEECSLDSSDEDSLGSSESSALATPVSVTTRKAKVKVENSCFIPLPSPSCMSGTKDRSNAIQESPSPVIKREPLCSPTRSPIAKAEEDLKRKLKVPPWPPDKKKNSAAGRMDVKWGCFGEKELQPPAAHAASRIFNNNHYDNLSNSVTPVDLTRKSALSSPNAKSPCSSSSPSASTCSSGGDSEKVKPSSPSPTKLNYPTSLTPNNASQRQSKSGKDVKFNEMCQKEKNGKVAKLESGKSSISNSTAFAWFQNPLVSYYPFYEQYYQYYCRYGFPQIANSMPPVDKAESQPKDDLENKGQEKSVSEPVFDKDEEDKGMLYQLLNKDKPME